MGFVRLAVIGLTLVTVACDIEATGIEVPGYAGSFESVSSGQWAGVLIDASKDLGVWWFPQTQGPFDPTLPHQGKALADHLRGQGLSVVEVPRFVTLDCELVSNHEVVVARASEAHSAAELLVYRRFVTRGGRLVLLEDHTPLSNLPSLFGLAVSGDFSGVLASPAGHPITTEVGPLPYRNGSIITAAPAGFRELASVDGLPAMGLVRFGLGEVFIIGDTNVLEGVPMPLTDNLFHFMLAGARTTPSCPVTAPSDLVNYLLTFDMGESERHALRRKLDAATRSLSRGKATPAIGQVRSFINQIHALDLSGRLPSADASRLIVLAEELVAFLLDPQAS